MQLTDEQVTLAILVTWLTIALAAVLPEIVDRIRRRK